MAVQEMRCALTSLRGHRDTLELDPLDPADALDKVLAETCATFDVGSARAAVLDRLDLRPTPPSSTA